MSLDFPYLGGWHDLCMCYRNTGWTIHDRLVESSDGSQPESSWKFVMGDLESPTQGRANISFAGFDASGEAAEPASKAVLFRPWFRVRRRLLRNISPRLFQVQVFASGNSLENEQLKQELQQLLRDARSIFRENVIVTKAK